MNSSILLSNVTTISTNHTVCSPLQVFLFVMSGLVVAFVLCFACGATYAHVKNNAIELCRRCRRCRRCAPCRRKHVPTVSTLSYDSMLDEL